MVLYSVADWSMGVVLLWKDVCLAYLVQMVVAGLDVRWMVVPLGEDDWRAVADTEACDEVVGSTEVYSMEGHTILCRHTTHHIHS